MNALPLFSLSIVVIISLLSSLLLTERIPVGSAVSIKNDDHRQR